MIPAEELILLADEQEVAFALAEQGQPLEAYRSLEAALAVVEALPPEPWREDLIDRYRLGLVSLVREFGINPCSPADPPVPRPSAHGEPQGFGE